MLICNTLSTFMKESKSSIQKYQPTVYNTSMTCITCITSMTCIACMMNLYNQPGTL